MKKILLPFTLAFLAASLFSACKNDETATDDPIVLACQPIKVIDSSEYSDGSFSESFESETTFTYSNDLMTFMANAYNYTYCVSENDCDSDTGVEEFGFVYQEGLLAEIQFYTDSQIDEIAEVVTENGRIVNVIETWEDQGVVRTDEFRIIYSGNKVSKIENWDDYEAGTPGQLALYDYVEFTWAGDNVSKVTDVQVYTQESGRLSAKRKRGLGNLQKRVSGQAEVIESTIEYTYDDKLNPFINTPVALMNFDEGYYFSKNNVLTEKYTEYYSGGQTEVETTTYAYEYNEQGFPITVAEGNSASDATTITYNCD